MPHLESKLVPNGKPGDDWYMDIVLHDLPTFSAQADRLIAELAQASEEPRPALLISVVNALLDSIGYEELASRAATVGMEYRNLRPSELRELERRVKALRDRM
jgi:hypothetical protein